MPKYDDVTVKLVGTDSNTMVMLGKVTAAVRRVHGHQAADEIAAKVMDAGSPDEALNILCESVNVE